MLAMSPLQNAARWFVAALLVSGAAFAQTAPAAPAQASSARAAAALPTKAVSALAVTLGKAVSGRLVSCPKGLRVSAQALCLYTKTAPAATRTTVRTALGNLASDWKLSGQAGNLLVQSAPNGGIVASVMLLPLGEQESLLVLDSVTARPQAQVTLPAGAVKGQPYLLDRDLAGVVNVIDLGSGKYRLNAAGQTALTITVGSKTAQRAGGNVDLPLAPVSDGKNLLFPLAGLRALGCTITENGGAATIACGSDSVGVRPIVF